LLCTCVCDFPTLATVSGNLFYIVICMFWRYSDPSPKVGKSILYYYFACVYDVPILAPGSERRWYIYVYIVATEQFILPLRFAYTKTIRMKKATMRNARFYRPIGTHFGPFFGNEGFVRGILPKRELRLWETLVLSRASFKNDSYSHHHKHHNSMHRLNVHIYIIACMTGNCILHGFLSL